MTDRAAEPLEARLLSAGDVRVFVAVGGDDVTVTRHDGAALRAFRADDVTEVRRDGDRLEIAVLRGEPVVLGGPRVAELDARLTSACMRLPELTRALRSLGSTRAGADAAAQREFFAPLLDARRRAEESVARADVVAAFDPERLGRAFEQYFAGLAARTEDARPAARRAFAAYTDDLAEPLRHALDELRRARDAALAPPAGARVAGWRRWTTALRRLFSAADRCWMALDRGGVPRSRKADE